ncbi:MAG: GNAT family N-acetyltransferase, partial [Bacteroidales bacterium]|nr:GNAT family N-acetyltransferase [Bacteroidales bacterium]
MTGTNLHLRAVEPSDVDLLYDWENNEKLWHISNTIEPFSRFAIEQYVMNADADIYAKKQLRLMIELKQPPQTIGHVDLFDFDPRNLRAGIGIMIMDEY